MFETLYEWKSKTTTTPANWQKIPWQEPAFSRRMLAEHLKQDHDRASRRFAIIDEHVNWIHRKILKTQPATILDLGCGPGFYTSRLAALGHHCKGVDISPASIAYANQHHPHIEHVLGDMRTLTETDTYDLVLLAYGEFNAFAPEDAMRIINNAHAALKPGGTLLLEVHPHAVIQRIGQASTSWHMAESGLFSDEPYLCLVESSFEDDCAISHYHVAEKSNQMTHYTTMHYAYTDDEYRHLLADFNTVWQYPSLTGRAETDDLFVFAAKK